MGLNIAQLAYAFACSANTEYEALFGVLFSKEITVDESGKGSPKFSNMSRQCKPYIRHTPWKSKDQ